MKEIKEKPIIFNTEMVQAILEGRKTQTRRVIKLDYAPHVGQCPYGLPGDMLYVRETWKMLGRPYAKKNVIYKASTNEAHPDAKWKPSIHMPKIFARIWLRVTDVKVERLQDITEADAIAEGVQGELCLETVPETGQDASGWGYRDYSSDFDDMYIHETARVSFETLWNSINLKRGYGWDTNTYVWVIDFERQK